MYKIQICILNLNLMLQFFWLENVVYVVVQLIFGLIFRGEPNSNPTAFMLVFFNSFAFAALFRELVDFIFFSSFYIFCFFKLISFSFLI